MTDIQLDMDKDVLKIELAIRRTDGQRVKAALRSIFAKKLIESSIGMME